MYSGQNAEGRILKMLKDYNISQLQRAHSQASDPPIQNWHTPAIFFPIGNLTLELGAAVDAPPATSLPIIQVFSEGVDRRLQYLLITTRTSDFINPVVKFLPFEQPAASFIYPVLNCRRRFTMLNVPPKTTQTNLQCQSSLTFTPAKTKCSCLHQWWGNWKRSHTQSSHRMDCAYTCT